MTTKTILLKLPEDYDKEESYPNYAYLSVNKTFEKTIENISYLIKANNLRSVLIDGKGFLDLVVDDKESYSDGVELFDAQSVDMVVSEYGFYFVISPDKNNETISIETEVLNFNEIELALNVNEGKIALTFTSEWDGSTIESCCTVNEFTGELDINESEELPDNDAALDRQYVSDEQGTEYRVFCNESTNVYFVAPHDFYNLVNNQAENELRPG